MVEAVSAIRVACSMLGVTEVVIVNVALVEFAATVTLGGTLTRTGALLERATFTPPIGAAAASVIVPVVGCPPVMSRIAMAKEFSGVEG